MFWYAHVYFYLFNVLLVITHLFKNSSWERKHYRMNNVNKQDKENKFFCVYTSRNILLIPRISIHRKYCKLRHNIVSIWNTSLSIVKESLTSPTERTNPYSDFNFVGSHFIWLCCSQTCFCIFTTTTHIVLSTSFYYTHNKRSLLLIAGTAGCFLQRNLISRLCRILYTSIAQITGIQEVVKLVVECFT